MNKNTILTIGLVATALLAIGCKRSERPDGESETSVSQKIDQIETDTRKAADDLRDFTHDQKGAFIEKLATHVSELNESIDELSAQVEKSSLAVQTEAKPRIAALQAQSDHLGKQLAIAKDASESTWESVKNGASEAYDELKLGLRNTREWMSEKIAP